MLRPSAKRRAAATLGKKRILVYVFIGKHAREDQKSPPQVPPSKKSSGDLAFVDLDGRRIYLGTYDSDEAREKYHRVLAEWQANGRTLPVSQQDLTILELLAHFLPYAAEYYRKADGTQSSEVSNFSQVAKLLKSLYGRSLVTAFGPLALKSVRHQMIEKGWVRSNINKQVSRLKQIFRWGVAEELVPPGIHQALLTVPGLKRGRCPAIESELFSLAQFHQTHYALLYGCTKERGMVLIRPLAAFGGCRSI